MPIYIDAYKVVNKFGDGAMYKFGRWTVFLIVFILIIEGSVWEYSMVGYPELSSFHYGFYQGDVYLIQNNQAFKIPDKNAYYRNDFSYVWQCEGLSCGFMLSFFSLGTAIEYVTYFGVPFYFVFDMENVGSVDEMQLSSAVNE